MKCVYSMLLSSGLCIAATGYAGEGSKKMHDASSVFAQKSALLYKHTPLIFPLIRIIVEYAPTLPFQWLPIIDEYDSSYQFNGPKKRRVASVGLNFTFFTKRDNCLHVRDLNVNENRISQENDPNVEDLNEEPMFEALYNKLGGRIIEKGNVKADVFDGDTLIERRQRLEYYLQYLLAPFRLIWVSPDSEVYQRAMRKSLFLLDYGVSMQDLGREMTSVYGSCKQATLARSYELSSDMDYISARQRSYMRDYESSAVPRLLKREYDGLVPVLYRLEMSKRAILKRKRERADIK